LGELGRVGVVVVVVVVVVVGEFVSGLMLTRVCAV
jgi:hypothetical protein